MGTARARPLQPVNEDVARNLQALTRGRLVVEVTSNAPRRRVAGPAVKVGDVENAEKAEARVGRTAGAGAKAKVPTIRVIRPASLAIPRVVRRCAGSFAKGTAIKERSASCRIAPLRLLASPADATCLAEGPQ